MYKIRFIFYEMSSKNTFCILAMMILFYIRKQSNNLHFISDHIFSSKKFKKFQ